MGRLLAVALALLLILCLATFVWAGGDGSTARIVATATTGASTPVEPVAGYAAWFKSTDYVFSDAGCSVSQATDGGDVACWQSSGGSYGALSVKVPGGYGAPAYEENEFNGKPVIRSQAASFELLYDSTSITAFEGGLLSVGSGTVFSVFKASGATSSIWGDGGGYLFHEVQTNEVEAYLYDTAARTTAKPYTGGTVAIATWHHEGGVLYSGVNDTRTSGMASATAGNMDAGATQLVVLGSAGPGRYLDGDLAELIFYPTALSEADRMLVERYLAAKYAVTIPY